MNASSKQVGLLYVALAVTAFSTTPVFIRWADPLSPFFVTGLRMLIGSATVFLIGLVQNQKPRIERRDWPRFALWGLVTAFHFVFYIASLSFTTVAHSLALVYTSPIWVSLFNRLINEEPLPKAKWIGIVITIVGMAVLSGFEPAWTWRMLLGDLMAIGSAITFGIYSATGRAQRERYPLWTYASGVYGMAGLWLLPLALLTFRVPEQLTLPLLSILILGVFPLGIGHTLYNAALRRTHPTLVNIIATQEVTGGVLLSWWLLGEVPTLNAVVGAVIMLAGVIQVVI
ncbi:MAG: EamA family transporter [Anaerolineae bacterium]|nr:EamA family transporter [Anaerolineae bacterium]